MKGKVVKLNCERYISDSFPSYFRYKKRFRSQIYNSKRFNPHIDEEFEDSEGNVVNRKTYDDMRRQGIL